MLPLPCLTINCFISSTFHFSSSEVHLIRRDSSEDPQTTETRQLYQQKNKDPESLECLLELTQEQNVCQVLLTFSSFWHWSNLEPCLVFEESEYNKTEAEFRKDVDVLWDTDKGGVVFFFLSGMAAYQETFEKLLHLGVCPWRCWQTCWWPKCLSGSSTCRSRMTQQEFECLIRILNVSQVMFFCVCRVFFWLTKDWILNLLHFRGASERGINMNLCTDLYAWLYTHVQISKERKHFVKNMFTAFSKHIISAQTRKKPKQFIFTFSPTSSFALFFSFHC